MSDLQFHPLDLVAIVAYLAAMAGIAVYFSRRITSTEEYFVGNRAFGGWVIGLSMLGTIISSATFVALPAAAYALDWRQLAVNFALPFVAVLAVVLFIPLFRQSRMTTAFEYLGRRFGSVARYYGTLSFIIMQLIRASQVLFLMALPIQFLSGAPLGPVILCTGIFVAFYTVVGGLDTVIWTDVAQACVLLIGGLLCAWYLISALPGGIGQVIQIGIANDKFSFGSFNWDLSQRTFWTISLLGIVNWLTIFGGDQNIVQRYVSAKSTREARKATLIYSAIALPLWTFFFFIGTSVFVFYHVFPSDVVNSLEADQVLPFFILHQLPVGISGVIIAAIIAAAMSTLDSSINAVSTVTIIDLLKPWLGDSLSDIQYLRLAKVTASIAATVMIAGALYFSYIPKESMNHISLVVTSIFGGCLMGLFMLGFFSRMVDGFAASCALIAAVIFNAYLGFCALGYVPNAWRWEIHSYWVGTLVNVCFIVVAYAVALLRGGKEPELKGLTVWTLNMQEPDTDEQQLPNL